MDAIVRGSRRTAAALLRVAIASAAVSLTLLAGEPDRGTGSQGALNAGPNDLPSDLPPALRLAGANNLQVAVARERIQEACARYRLAKTLWLPDLVAGPTWMHHDGRIQETAGAIIETSKSSFFLGGGAVLSVGLADAIFEPLVTRQIVRAESST